MKILSSCTAQTYLSAASIFTRCTNLNFITFLLCKIKYLEFIPFLRSNNRQQACLNICVLPAHTYTIHKNDID